MKSHFGSCIGDQFGEVPHAELLRELVEDAKLAHIRGLGDGDLHALDGVADIEIPAGLRRCNQPTNQPINKIKSHLADVSKSGAPWFD